MFHVVILTACMNPAQDLKTFLYLVDAETEQLIWSTEVSKGDQFVLEYIHSVHKTPVSDSYLIGENNQIVLFRTAFSTFGAGMPYEADYSFSIEDDRYVISDLNLTFAEILLRVVPIAEHRIIINDDIIFMNDLVPQGTLLAIYVR